MKKLKRTIFKIIILFQSFEKSLGLLFNLEDVEGRLVDPPGRSSLWRSNIPGSFVNLNDYKLNCGGKENQWDIQNGKCGICGDTWNGPREHEFGGKYFTNYISSVYKAQSVINITVDIKSNSFGWIEFRIHRHMKDIDQAALDKYLLEIGDTGRTRYRVRNSGYHIIPVTLPSDLVCERCLLQWKYHSGTSWGCEEKNGHRQCCLGCGTIQEEIYNCADISVVRNENTKTAQHYQNVNGGIEENLKFPRIKENINRGRFLQWWCSQQCIGEECAECHHLRFRRQAKSCQAVGIWRAMSYMKTWCQNNCNNGYCPSSHCVCEEESTSTSTIPTTVSKTTTSQPTTTPTTHAHTTTSFTRSAPGIVRVFVSRGCEYCKDKNDQDCAALYCPGYIDQNLDVKGSLYQKISELSDYFCTTCDTNDTICEKLFCSPENVMLSLGIHAKCRMCLLTSDCVDYPECDKINNRDLTTTTSTTRQTTTAQPITKKSTTEAVGSLMKNCIAINKYAEIIGMDQWCQDNCGNSVDLNCYSDICRCMDPGAPIVQKMLNSGDKRICKASSTWANIPGMDKWCSDNCPHNCPVTHCICSSPSTPPTETTTTIPTTTTTMESTSTTSTATEEFSTPLTTTQPNGGVDYYSINSMNGIMCKLCLNNSSLYQGCSDLYCNRFDSSLEDPPDMLNRTLTYSPELFCGVQGKDSVFCEPDPIIRPFILSTLCSACIYLSPNQNCAQYCSSS